MAMIYSGQYQASRNFRDIFYKISLQELKMVLYLHRYKGNGIKPEVLENIL
jgi:hypothetical protein